MPTVEVIKRSKKGGMFKAVDWAACPGVTPMRLRKAGYNPLAINHFRKIRRIMGLIKRDTPPRPGSEMKLLQWVGIDGKAVVWNFKVKQEDLLLARRLLAREKVWLAWKKKGVIDPAAFLRPPIEY